MTLNPGPETITRPQLLQIRGSLGPWGPQSKKRPIPPTLNPKTQTSNPKPQTSNPKHSKSQSKASTPNRTPQGGSTAPPTTGQAAQHAGLRNRATRPRRPISRRPPPYPINRRSSATDILSAHTLTQLTLQSKGFTSRLVEVDVLWKVDLLSPYLSNVTVDDSRDLPLDPSKVGVLC